MPDIPLISVGLPVYNGSDFLDETITSILDQDIEGMELIISDNGSTDNTRSIIERRAREDDRIRSSFSDENRGAAWNFNHVLSMARGNYFHWSGYDDLMEPTMLRRCIEALKTHEGSVLSYPQTRIIDEHGALTEDYDNGMHLDQADPAQRLKQYLSRVDMANPIFGVLPTEHIRGVGGLGSYPSADLVTLARLALRGKVIEVPERLFMRRIHARQSWRRVGLYEGFASWFDPSNKKKIVFTDWRVFGELLRACFKEELSLGERVRSVGMVLYYWPRRRFRRLFREIMRVGGFFRSEKA